MGRLGQVMDERARWAVLILLVPISAVAIYLIVGWIGSPLLKTGSDPYLEFLRRLIAVMFCWAPSGFLSIAWEGNNGRR